MPRKGGVFDPRSDKEAFDEGRRERESGDQTEWDQFFESSWDIPPNMVLNRDTRTSQERAYDAGHESTTRKYRSDSRSSRPHNSKSSSGGGGRGPVESSEGGGILFFGIVAGAIIGLLYGGYYAGGQLAQIKNPNDYTWDLLCGVPILGLIVGALGLGFVGALLEWLRGSFK